jgi:hypothetical protein
MQRGKPKRNATMTKEDLVKLFPGYDPSGHAPSKATQKGFAHQHKPTWKPPKAKMSPAEWGRMQRRKKAGVKPLIDRESKP